MVQSTSNYGTDTTFNSNDNLIVISYKDYAGTDLRIIDGTVSGTSISFGSSSIILDGGGYSPVDSTAASNHAVENIFDSNVNKTISVFRNMRNSNYGTAIAYTSAVPTNLTTENYIGIATGGSYADGQNVTVDVIGTVNDDQSSLTAGQQYFVQEDGTLGLTADSTSVVAGTAISATELIVKE